MIAAYQRISRADGDLGKDGKDKSNSIENQKELIQRYIACKESLQNVPVMDFVDDGYTGSNFDRPGFQQMMDGVRNGKIDTIIVKDLSRFGRDYIGVGEYMEQIFPLLGVRLIAINDNYDSNNYDGGRIVVRFKYERSILIHVITFGSNSRARGRVAHFDGTASLLVHPIQIGLGVWNFRLNLKNVCTDGIRQIFGNFCGDTAGRKVGDKSFAHGNALPLDDFV